MAVLSSGLGSQCRKFRMQIEEVGRADMDIFELVDNEKFFNPLSSQNRRIYMEHAEELKNELLDLKDSIAGIMRMVMELQDANSVGKFLMKDELLDKFFNDYFFLKNSGMIPSRLSFIKNKLRVIE